MAKTISQLETAMCLVRADLITLPLPDDQRELVFTAIRLAEKAVQPEPNLVEICECQDYISNIVVKMDKERRALTPSLTYPV